MNASVNEELVTEVPRVMSSLSLYAREAGTVWLQPTIATPSHLGLDSNKLGPAAAGGGWRGRGGLRGMASSNVVIITLNIDITAAHCKHKHCSDPDWAISLNYLTNNIYIFYMEGYFREDFI